MKPGMTMVWWREHCLQAPHRVGSRNKSANDDLNLRKKRGITETLNPKVFSFNSLGDCFAISLKVPYRTYFLANSSQPAPSPIGMHLK
jgi:hypothetical protein